MSSFGNLFSITTFGESHCRSVGVVIQNCPPRLELTEADIQPQLTRRRPGQSKITTPRSEADIVSVLSGTENGLTLGTPICLKVDNLNVKKKDYSEMKKIPRPGHADFSYQMKYGIRASSGGGRSSARETIGRVAAGAVAEKYLRLAFGTEIVSFVASVGDITIPKSAMKHPSGRNWTREEIDLVGTVRLIRNNKGWKKVDDENEQKELDASDEEYFLSLDESDPSYFKPAYVDLDNKIYDRNGNLLYKETIETVSGMLSDDLVPTRCPDIITACKLVTKIRKVKSEKDSIGGTVVGIASGVPVGLGEPCFDKLEAKLAHAMLSLPATKGFEIGSGFEGTKLQGSQHNDAFTAVKTQDGKSNRQDIRPDSNNAGGTLGGISTGEDIYFRVAIKPVSTIGQAQDTVDFYGDKATLSAKGRHDPCVLPRAPPLIESMTSLVLMDAALVQLSRANSVLECAKIETIAYQKHMSVEMDPNEG